MATASVTNQFTASTTIVSDDVDTNFADLVTFLNGSVLHVDGAKAMTGDLDMGNQDINNVPWKTWVPTYANITKGNGTVVARYIQIGDLVVAEFLLTFGSSTVMGSSHTISLPVTSDTSFGGSTQDVGLARLEESGGSTYHGHVIRKTATTCSVVVRESSATYLRQAPVTASVPFTWGTGDILSFNISYEAA